MRKLFIVLLALMLTASLAFAADGYPSRAGYVKMSTYSPTTCTHVTTSPSLVYGITIRAKQAAGWCALADSAQTGSLDADAHWTAMQTYGNLKAIVSEATQYADEVVWFDPPIYFQNGIFYIEGYSGTLETGNGGDGTDTIIYYTGA